MREPKEYYDSIGEKEWRRLAKDPYHMLEFEITMHFMREHLPKEGGILDAGGGPGRYSIELARMGYEVVLFDISRVQLNIAEEKFREHEQEVRNRISGIKEGSVTDLSDFDDDSFDSVLCLGTLSHLIEEEDRKESAKELVRVLKVGSPIFASGIGRYSTFRVILRDLPGELTEPGHGELFTDGVHHGHDIIKEDGRDFKRSTTFPDAYFFLPDELPGLFNECDVETLELASCEGLSAHLDDATNSLYEDQEKWKKWFQIVLETCTEPSIIGMGEHLLFVGRKK